METHDRQTAITGSLLGLAVGDALGLPFEHLSPDRVRRLHGGPERHHLLPGRGMFSDDTEHTIMVAQSLIESGDDSARFRRRLAHRLRLWFLGLPAGIGLATLRACLKLMLGVPAEHSGVWSAGNGPAMRAPLLGVVFGHDSETLRAFVTASTEISHRDPQALHGALAVALAAHIAAQGNADGKVFLAAWRTLLPAAESAELTALLQAAVASVEAGDTTAAFCRRCGLDRGVTGYMLHTVPVVIHAWLRNPTDYRAGILEIIRCGGDTDTTAAILGGILGAGTGEQGIPAAWLDGIIDFPRSVRWIRLLAARLLEARVSGEPAQAPHLSATGIALRNLLFMGIVLAHGLRRLLPPY